MLGGIKKKGFSYSCSYNGGNYILEDETKIKYVLVVQRRYKVFMKMTITIIIGIAWKIIRKKETKSTIKVGFLIYWNKSVKKCNIKYQFFLEIV